MNQLQIKPLPFPLTADELNRIGSEEMLDISRPVEPQEIVVDEQDETYIQLENGTLELPGNIGYMGLEEMDWITVGDFVYKVTEIYVFLDGDIWHWCVSLIKLLSA